MYSVQPVKHLLGVSCVSAFSPESIKARCWCGGGDCGGVAKLSHVRARLGSPAFQRIRVGLVFDGNTYPSYRTRPSTLSLYQNLDRERVVTS